ncbi:MAG: hypothetical protein JSW54_10225 [Fidelibacterota bacterium]|nr:MAG: hypothetical protein JSW54_10225 [Candidatus Neomarinimicrobiota bacterium]
MRPLQSRIIVFSFLAIILLTTGCAGPGAAHRKTAIHTGYAYAFLSKRADRIQDKNLQRARKMYLRARRHYVKAFQAGLAQLEKRHPGFNDSLMMNPGQAAAMTTAEDVPLLYWTAAALGSAIGLSKDRPDMLIRLAQIGTLAYRVTELQPDFMDGAAYELLMIYEASRPAMMGGSLSLARHYYEQALSYSQGSSAGLFVSYAEVICIQEQDRENFVAMLDKALSVKTGGVMNRMAKRRAKWLLKRIDDLFL